MYKEMLLFVWKSKTGHKGHCPFSEAQGKDTVVGKKPYILYSATRFSLDVREFIFIMLLRGGSLILSGLEKNNKYIYCT